MRRVAALCLVISLIIIPISAEETLPEEYSDFSSAIPEDVASMLPEGFFSGNISELSDSLLTSLRLNTSLV